MSAALEIAAIGLRVQQRALETIANNISNMNTPAYKRAEVRFSELVDQPVTADADTQTVSHFDSVAGVGLTSRPMVDVQGQMEVTGNLRDLAIDGSGFIELMGPAGKTLLWRGGTLRVLEDGVLATASGVPLKANISVPTEATGFRIDRDGKVYATVPNQTSDSQIGTLNLVKMSDAASVERLDGGIYAVADQSQLTEAAPGEDGVGYIVQASQERSNVDLNTEMVGMLISQRAYAANAQVIRAADELMSIANGLRR